LNLSLLILPHVACRESWLWQHLWQEGSDPLNRTSAALSANDSKVRIGAYVLDGYYPTTAFLPGRKEAFQRLAQQDCLSLQEFWGEVSSSPEKAWQYLSSFFVDFMTDDMDTEGFKAGLLSS
jgi:hypothetical protein